MIATIISRGHSGTRIPAQILHDNGFYMGSKLNESYDLVPVGKPLNIYRSCSLIGRRTKYLGNYKWDFSEVFATEPTYNFKTDVNIYLDSILNNDSEFKGWKLPETLLIYPWIVKMFPDIKYIYMIRHPIDCIRGEHLTDDLAFFDVPTDGYPRKKIVRFTDTGRLEVEGKSSIEQRIMSWKYQYQIFKATPKPKNLIEIRYEDLILDQDNTLRELGRFLGTSLEKIEVNKEPAFRSLRTLSEARRRTFNVIFESELKEYNYK